MTSLHIRTCHSLTVTVSVGVGTQHDNLPTFTDAFYTRETRAQLLGKGNRKIGGSTIYELNGTEIGSRKSRMVNDLVDKGRH